MFSDATVNLPLSDFDEIRQGFDDFQTLAQQISNCFEYKSKERPEPEECKNCNKGIINCVVCDVHDKLPPFDYEEELFVDIDALLVVTQEYATYAKNVYTGTHASNMPLKTSWDSLKERRPDQNEEIQS